MITWRELLIFVDLSFLWVWEWFHEEKILCLKLWVLLYWEIKCVGFNICEVLNFLFYFLGNRTSILIDFS